MNLPESISENSNIPQVNEAWHDTSYEPSTLGGQNKNENKNKKENIKNTYTSEETPVDNVDNVDNFSSPMDKSMSDVRAKVPYEEIIALFNKTCKSLPKVIQRSEARDKAIRSLWKRLKFSVEAVEKFFKRVENSDFLTGRVGGWNGNFDWILKQSNFIKIQEGNYDNKAASKPVSIKGNFNNYQQRDYDYDDLEKKLLGWE
ncbi:hypothetical protein IAI10_13215 [Clostridium sp. 19966]|uniref:hypothetical protein n=1 Tax=Clostridium sp. 19966 TaxID=2768166 RepID=UPI0028DFB641|nr:hypothetical protein [Clostridium sp. 19966]MDT8717626.1 hypothetical protein [Clostridium sp. 19966]